MPNICSSNCWKRSWYGFPSRWRSQVGQGGMDATSRSSLVYSHSNQNSHKFPKSTKIPRRYTLLSRTERAALSCSSCSTAGSMFFIAPNHSKRRKHALPKLAWNTGSVLLSGMETTASKLLFKITTCLDCPVIRLDHRHFKSDLLDLLVCLIEEFNTQSVCFFWRKRFPLIMHLVRMNCQCDDLKRQRGNLHYEWYEMSLTIFDILPQLMWWRGQNWILWKLTRPRFGLAMRTWMAGSESENEAGLHCNLYLFSLTHRNDYCHLRRE